jgi:anti-sigma factor RsiW
MHAALCEHCGPLLRAAASVNEDATPREEKLLSRLSAPSRPGTISPAAPVHWRFTSWLVPAVAFIVIAGVLGVMPPAPASLSGSKFAEFAVLTHRQQFRERLAFDVRSDSPRDLNEWLKAKSPFSLVLPSSPAMPGEERPYHLDGARLVPVSGRTAAFIAYRMHTSPVSLMVAPDSVAMASGGTVVDYKKVSFHYNTVEGYKVVTWSVHGLTYALVSQEGNRTQTSCMVCHSDLRDRDLSHTPTPLPAERNPVEPLLQ